jgi:thymidylate synthase (FAD)
MQLDEAAQEKIISKVIGLGHFSVLEHVSFSFGIEGVSRACSHQLVRHRLASFCQKSQRYVKANTDNFGYHNDYQDQCVWPESIMQAPDNVKFAYHRALRSSHEAYYHLVTNYGIPPEDARMVLPSAERTSLVMTMNARELHHFFTLRCCNRAQHEIREMAKLMLMQCREVAPLLFSDAGPSCLRGKCAEGSMCCGEMDKVREEFRA